MEWALGSVHRSTDTSDLLISEALGFIPDPNDDFDIWLSCQSDQKTLLARGREVTRYELFWIIIRRCQDLLPGECRIGQVKNSADGSLWPLTHGEVPLRWRDGQSGNSFRAFDTWNVSLALIIDIVDDDVVTTRVKHSLVIQMEQILLDIALKSTEELWNEGDVLSSFLGFVKSRSDLWLVLLTGSCSLRVVHKQFKI